MLFNDINNVLTIDTLINTSLDEQKLFNVLTIDKY